MARIRRGQRVALIEDVLSKLSGGQDGASWPMSRVNNVLEGFGLAPVSEAFSDNFLDDVPNRLHSTDDDTLVEIHEYVTAGGRLDPAASPADEGEDLWQPEHIRVFLSHTAQEKKFAQEVADHLTRSGIHGFVAHESIEITHDWQLEIEKALRSAQVFVALVHPPFLKSAWCNQEVGWARGRDMPMYMIRFGADPIGFPGRTQWPSMTHDESSLVATKIKQWINSLPQFSDAIAGALLAALEKAGNYFDAGDAAQDLNEFDALTSDQWKELDRIYLANDQVHGGVLAHRGLKPLYARHDRGFPERN